MLNVIYEHRANKEREVKKDIVEAQREYLQERIEKYKTILRLTEEDTTFIVNLLLLIARYMAYIVPIEEYNTITFARLVGYCPLISCGEGPLFLSMVETAIENKEGELTEEKVSKLKVLFDQVMKTHMDEKVLRAIDERVLLAIHVLQIDCMLNCDINSAAARLINLAAIKNSGKWISDAGEDAISSLENELLDFDCATSCFDQFNSRHKELRGLLKNEHYDMLTQYAYELFERLPMRIKNKINKYDFHIYVSNELLGNKMSMQPDGVNTTGSFYYYEKQLHVWFLAKTREMIDRTLNHEIGHVVDYIIGQENDCFGKNMTDDNTEWETIYTKEKDLYCQEKIKIAPEWEYVHRYESSIPSEYFAGVFAAYIDIPEWLKESCPLTYNHIDNLLNTYL